MEDRASISGLKEVADILERIGTSLADAQGDLSAVVKKHYELGGALQDAARKLRKATLEIEDALDQKVSRAD